MFSSMPRLVNFDYYPDKDIISNYIIGFLSPHAISIYVAIYLDSAYVGEV
jgi:hypothetical protein